MSATVVLQTFGVAHHSMRVPCCAPSRAFSSIYTTGIFDWFSKPYTVRRVCERVLAYVSLWLLGIAACPGVCGGKNMDICVRLIGCAGLGSGAVSVGVRVSVSSKESVNVRSSVNGSEKRCAATHEK